MSANELDRLSMQEEQIKKVLTQLQNQKPLSQADFISTISIVNELFESRQSFCYKTIGAFSAASLLGMIKPEPDIELAKKLIWIKSKAQAYYETTPGIQKTDHLLTMTMWKYLISGASQRH
ncbi:MAG TPA: hypothetical protein VG895_03460 [Patescibacteria group bacterium]|nr:hypothetical protein [Patescibacteria group bacterium]